MPMRFFPDTVVTIGQPVAQVNQPPSAPATNPMCARLEAQLSTDPPTGRRPVNSLVGANMAFRRSVLEAVA